jgi:hypothetical protein
MSHRGGYRPGDFLRICDVCGFACYASQTRKRWDGAWVCLADWEPRHPQDFVRGGTDNQTVPEPRPEPADGFTDFAGNLDVSILFTEDSTEIDVIAILTEDAQSINTE